MIDAIFTIYSSANYKLLSDELKMNFTLQNLDGNSTSPREFSLMQDLTDTFRQLYPDKEMGKVLITSSAKKFITSYY